MTGPRRVKLTEQEGLVLALAARLEKPTAHEIFTILDGSPTRSVRASKGSIYPIVARLRERGLIEATPLNDGRRSELLAVTPEGREAIRVWLEGVDREQVLPYDPLRVRLPTLELLDKPGRLRWIERARELNHEMRKEIDNYCHTVEMSFAEVSHQSALEHLNAQLRWLDRLQIAILEDRHITKTRSNETARAPERPRARQTGARS